jgi:hypothetical protein
MARGIRLSTLCRSQSLANERRVVAVWTVRVFSASLYDMIFGGCYHTRRQQRYLMRPTYEEPIEIKFRGNAFPWTRAF